MVHLTPTVIVSVMFMTSTVTFLTCIASSRGTVNHSWPVGANFYTSIEHGKMDDIHRPNHAGPYCSSVRSCSGLAPPLLVLVTGLTSRRAYATAANTVQPPVRFGGSSLVYDATASVSHHHASGNCRARRAVELHSI